MSPPMTPATLLIAGFDGDDHFEVDTSCGQCGGSCGHNDCWEGFCSCLDGDECWIECQACGGTGER